MEFVIKVKLGNQFYLDSRGGCTERFHMQSYSQYTEYFLPRGFTYKFVDDIKDADIVLWDNVFDEYTSDIIPRGSINILVCVENADYWKGENSWYYRHYDREKNRELFDICIYNHITSIARYPAGCVEIPMLYKYIGYYKQYKETILPSSSIHFKDKKFCIRVNRSGLNSDIDEVSKALSKLGEVDDISLYSSEILNTSCYHSIELINVLNKYKFVICFENSYSNGYITEKIFNCFFARTIPIYKGDPDVCKYIRPSCFVDGRSQTDDILDKINTLANDESAYSECIAENKIQDFDETNESIVADRILTEVILRNKSS
jgi:hypothetical protein